jgi:hypothetical protein
MWNQLVLSQMCKRQPEKVVTTTMTETSILIKQRSHPKQPDHGAGSENLDHLFSGSSDHLPVARPGQKIVGDSVSGEGKDDRDAQTT